MVSASSWMPGKGARLKPFKRVPKSKLLLFITIFLFAQSLQEWRLIFLLFPSSFLLKRFWLFCPLFNRGWLVTDHLNVSLARFSFSEIQVRLIVFKFYYILFSLFPPPFLAWWRKNMGRRFLDSYYYFSLLFNWLTTSPFSLQDD